MDNGKKPVAASRRDNIIRDLTNTAGAALLVTAVANGLSTPPEQKRTNNIEEQGDSPEERRAKTIAGSLVLGGATAALLSRQRKKDNEALEKTKQNGGHSL